MGTFSMGSLLGDRIVGTRRGGREVWILHGALIPFLVAHVASCEWVPDFLE